MFGLFESKNRRIDIPLVGDDSIELAKPVLVPPWYFSIPVGVFSACVAVLMIRTLVAAEANRAYFRGRQAIEKANETHDWDVRALAIVIPGRTTGCRSVATAASM